MTICNLPREVRFLREETFLLATIPGPKEPSVDQINHVIEPIVRDLLALEEGEFPVALGKIFISS